MDEEKRDVPESESGTVPEDDGLVKIQNEVSEIQDENPDKTGAEGDHEAPAESIASELEARIKQIEELNSRYLRLLADFDNFRKRAAREKQDFYNNALEDVILQLLPVLDNFERALARRENSEASNGFLEGFEMIFRQFMGVLEKLGLSEIDALGKPFDPYFHNAVMKAPSEEHEENTVIEVLQKGYKLKDKVIRPSMVKVSGD